MNWILKNQLIKYSPNIKLLKWHKPLDIQACYETFRSNLKLKCSCLVTFKPHYEAKFISIHGIKLMANRTLIVTKVKYRIMQVIPSGLLSLHLKIAIVPMTTSSIQNRRIIEHSSPAASTFTNGAGMLIRQPINQGSGNL